MSTLHDKLIAKLEAVASQFDELDRQLLDPQVAMDHAQSREVSIKRAAIADMVGGYRRYQAVQRQIADNELLVADKADRELSDMAAAELPQLKAEAEKLLNDIASEMVTADDRSIGSVILEVRSAAGGLEAALWAGDVLEMYRRYAALRGWKWEVLEFSAGDAGGIRNATIAIEGQGVWQRLGYEGGVHCVKRVPATETQGRIHTSTCTVAVLPQPEKVDLVIPESEVTMHITTAQGPGGQNVNKVATAVHLIHNPTGIEVRMQESKSQQQNRAKAWQLLRARIFDLYQRKKHAERAEKRAAMIGSGERSERIRTYRYKESVAVDHRLNATYNLQPLLAGQLDDVVDALITQDRAERLAAL